MKNKSNKPKKSDFPVYCFDPIVRKDFISVQIPIQMWDDDKKYNSITKELKSFMKNYGFEISGGGCAIGGDMYDINFCKIEQ